MLSRDEIARLLLHEVRAARTAYENAHKAFNFTTADIPSNLPAPDGTQRLILAGKTYRYTMKAYDKVVREYNNFLLTGEVPPRFKEELKLDAEDK